MTSPSDLTTPERALRWLGAVAAARPLRPNSPELHEALVMLLSEAMIHDTSPSTVGGALLATLRTAWAVGFDAVIADIVARSPAGRAGLYVEPDDGEDDDEEWNDGFTDSPPPRDAVTVNRRPFAVDGVAHAQAALVDLERMLEDAQDRLKQIRAEASAWERKVLDSQASERRYLEQRKSLAGKWEAMNTAELILEGKAKWFATCKMYGYYNFWEVGSFDNVALYTDRDSTTPRGCLRALSIVSDAVERRQNYGDAGPAVTRAWAEFNSYSDGSGGTRYKVLAFETEAEALARAKELNTEVLKGHLSGSNAQPARALAYVVTAQIDVDLTDDQRKIAADEIARDARAAVAKAREEHARTKKELDAKAAALKAMTGEEVTPCST